MKDYILLIVVLAFYTTTTFAEPIIKKLNIRTVDDVKELRVKVINKMSERINSGELSEKQINLLEKRIIELSSKPLPTQDQINEMTQNNQDIPSIKERIKALRKLRKEGL